MENELGFKGAIFGGYNKLEVDEYIEKIKSEHDQQIQDLSNNLKELEMQLSSSISKSYFDEVVASKDSENNLLKTKLDDVEYATRIYKDKASKYDEISDKVESVLNDAKDRASKLVLDAQERVKKFDEHIKLKENRYKENIRIILNRARDEYNELFEYMTSVQDDFRQAFEKVDARILDIKGRLTKIHDEELISSKVVSGHIEED